MRRKRGPEQTAMRIWKRGRSGAQSPMLLDVSSVVVYDEGGRAYVAETEGTHSSGHLRGRKEQQGQRL